MGNNEIEIIKTDSVSRRIDNLRRIVMENEQHLLNLAREMKNRDSSNSQEIDRLLIDVTNLRIQRKQLEEPAINKQLKELANAIKLLFLSIEHLDQRITKLEPHQTGTEKKELT